MRSAIDLFPEAANGSGPDLTRYALVCAGAIATLLVLAWVFRRYLAERLKARAARRSLQVLDVLPLSGKQKLVVVRCYDRSFLLGLGDKEVRSIAELELELEPFSAPAPLLPSKPLRAFAAALKQQLAGRSPARATSTAAPDLPPDRTEAPLAAASANPGKASLSRDGVVA